MAAQVYSINYPATVVYPATFATSTDYDTQHRVRFGDGAEDTMMVSNNCPEYRTIGAEAQYAAQRRAFIARNANSAWYEEWITVDASQEELDAIANAIASDATNKKVKRSRRANTSVAIEKFVKLSPQEVKALSPEARKAYDTARNSAKQQAARERKRMGA